MIYMYPFIRGEMLLWGKATLQHLIQYIERRGQTPVLEYNLQIVKEEGLALEFYCFHIKILVMTWYYLKLCLNNFA